MTSVFTLFLNPYAAAWPDDVADPLHSRSSMQMSGGVIHNIIGKKLEQIELDNTETRTVDHTNVATTDWRIVIAKVVGSCRFNLTGLDTDDSTAITSKIPGYGTSLYPGIVVFSTYNLSAIQIEALADNTVVELFSGIAAEDDDTRLDDYD